ncbi:MAG: flagellar biosynthetic protein FliO [Burkholderiales bacterium]|nr:flagellar biosynthetic protein FliO [Burkholderiales bacterium]
MTRAFGCALLAASLPASAQEAASPLAAGNLLQVFAGLLLVLALVLGAALVLRRIGRIPGLAGDVIKTLGATAVGTRERVVLLEIADTWIVVGVAPGQVRSLATLPRAELPAAASANAPAFAHLLQRLTERRNAR